MWDDMGAPEFVMVGAEEVTEGGGGSTAGATVAVLIVKMPPAAFSAVSH